MKAIFEFVLEHIHRPYMFILGAPALLYGLLNIRGGKYILKRGVLFEPGIRKGYFRSRPVKKEEGEKAQKSGRSFIRLGIIFIIISFVIMLTAFIS